MAFLFDSYRNKAKILKTLGPRILVIGKPLSGKSSICKLMWNYALKNTWNPILVDLDIQDNLFMSPWWISAGLIDMLIW